MRKDILKKFRAAFNKASEPRPFTKGAISVRKSEDGQWNLLGRFTNPYRDTDFHSNPLNGGDIITDEAHKEFSEWLSKNRHHALELWSYHQWGTARKSRANWWSYTGNFFYMNWPLTEEEAKGISTWAMDNEPGMSFGFYVFKSNWEEGLIEKYRAFEASILPLSRAANPWTTFILNSKESNMKFADKDRADLAKIHGESFVSELEKMDDEAAAILDNAGVERRGKKEAEVIATSEEVVVTATDLTLVDEKGLAFATEQSVVGALEKLQEAFSEALNTVVEENTKTVTALAEQVLALTTQVKDLTNTAIADSKAAATPMSILTSFTPKSILSRSKDVVETQKSSAEIDGRSGLAKQAPAGANKKRLGVFAQDVKEQVQ